MRTTIIHHGALGDWLLVMPMIRALLHHHQLHQLHPHDTNHPTPTTITAGQSYAKSKLACRLIPQLTPLTIDTPAWADLFTADANPSPHVVDALQKSDRIISFVSTPRDVWSNNVARIAPNAKLHCLLARPSAFSTQHITDFHATQLAAQGLHYTPAIHNQSDLKKVSGTFISSSHTPPHTHTLNTTNLPILIHPGTAGRPKAWPTILWESFIAHAQNDGWNLQPVLGEVELETWSPATIARWTHQFAAVACNTLDELCDLLQSSRGFIGLDSGPAHLSAAMNLTTIVLFGPTSPAVWSPVGKNVHTIAPNHPSPMSWLQPERIKSAMEQVF